MFPEPDDEFFCGYDATPVRELAARIAGQAHALPSETTLSDFDDRDLFALAEAAGFEDIQLDLHRESIRVVEPQTWQAFLRSSPNPLAPRHGDVIDAALSAVERQRLERHLRPLVEGGMRMRRLATAHLWACRR